MHGRIISSHAQELSLHAPGTSCLSCLRKDLSKNYHRPSRPLCSSNTLDYPHDRSSLTQVTHHRQMIPLDAHTTQPHNRSSSSHQIHIEIHCLYTSLDSRQYIRHACGRTLACGHTCLGRIGGQPMMFNRHSRSIPTVRALCACVRALCLHACVCVCLRASRSLGLRVYM